MAAIYDIVQIVKPGTPCSYPIGPDNDRWLRDPIDGSSLTVAAWGNHGSHMGRASSVRKSLGPDLHILRITKQGQPEHPLFLPSNLKPVDWK
jgi:hypothetical protein